ncbi:MAG: rhodanese-like domain-containing protein [Gammaproteobacteria bacterium]|nr:rhodanese-like domain-containing protein [Gammaproteobacteria bacterium]
MTSSRTIPSRGFRALVESATGQVKTLSLAEALALHQQDAALFVDLRDVRELRREGRIPGSFHCPRGMLEFWIDPDSPYYQKAFNDRRPIVFVCNLGWRSALATRTAGEMGIEPVSHLEGGTTAWKEAGAPWEAMPERAKG